MSDATVILHLIGSNFFGGPEKQIVQHLRRLDGTGYTGLIASYEEYGRPNDTLITAAAAGVPTRALPMYGPLDLRAQLVLGRLVRDEKVDLICAHGYKACVMGVMAARSRGIPVLVFSRGYTAENRRIALYEWLDRRFLGRADGVVFVSGQQRKRLDELGVRPRRSWVVQNAVEAGERSAALERECRNELLEELSLPSEGRLIVAAGRLSPEKGHRFLVEAIPAVVASYGSATFLFCGEGVCREELAARAAELGVARHCRFLGFRKDMDRIYRAMDLLALPSLTEGLPNVVLEAFAVGRAVVATRVGGVPELVEDGVSGRLVAPSDPEALAAAIRDCLADAERLRGMGERGYERVRGEFSFEGQARQLREIYDSLLGRNG